MATQDATWDFNLKGTSADVAVEARPRPHGNGRDGALARGLGWFSVGLGVAEVAAPGVIANAIGVRDSGDNRELLRAAGLREIASGIGILTRDRQAGWVWARVGGDVMDLALLGLGFTSPDAQPRRLGVATAAVAGVTALDVWCSRQIGNGVAGDQFVYATRATTINRAASEVYAFWHDFQNLPRFMRHLDSVHVGLGKRSHWVANGPAGTRLEWDAEIVDDRPGELIAWRSLPGAQVENSGSVSFQPAPGGRGTEVMVRLRFSPPGGALGAGVAWLFGEHPDQQLQDDLRRFKQVMETGEIARSEASESLLGMSQPGQPREMKPYREFARGER
jgi:uncharacterized membrane protein